MKLRWLGLISLMGAMLLPALMAKSSYATGIYATQGPSSIFNNRTINPGQYSDGQAVELGVKFKTRGALGITGLRFYKAANDPDTSHVGRLWTGTGQLLKTVTFTNETASGWQEAIFDSPVLPTAGVTFVASYLSNSGHYVATSGGLTRGENPSGDPTNPIWPVYAPGSLEVNGNGVYQYGGGFPTQTYKATNYWVDVVVDDTVAPSAPSGLDSPSQTPHSVDLTWSPSIDGTGELRTGVAYHHVYRDGVLYESMYGSITQFTDSYVVPGTTHTYYVVGEDYLGNLSSLSNSISVTVPPAIANQTIFGNRIPANPVDSDQSPVELGVKFQSTADGYIKAIRFYRGAPNGMYTVHLWSGDGQLLAISGASEGQGPTPGWQEVSLYPAVHIQANQTYVASYYTSNGSYAGDNYGLTNAVTTGNLKALGSGVYHYGTGGVFPTDTYQDSNYWVDVLFSTAAS